MLSIVLVLAATFTRSMERVSTMDPALARSMYDSAAIQLVYETPLNIDYRARPYRLVAGYCELPRVDDSALVYTFPIAASNRENSAAARMVRSLERLRDPAIVSPNGWILKDVDTIRAIGSRAVEIRLKRRCHFFPWLMAMSPAAVRDEWGDGTGHYRLTHWRRNHEMVFSRRVPGEGFDAVRYLVVDDASTQWLMFLKGELDYLGEISRDNFDVVVGRNGALAPELAQRGIRLCTYASMDVMHIGFNMLDPVVGKNRKLRQALNAAFNHPAWSDFYSGRVIPADTPVPPGIGGRLNTAYEYGFNLALAKRLIAEAGYPEGVDPTTGRRLTLTLAIGRATQSSREQGELIASFFEKIGVRLELDFKTWDAFLKAVNEGRVQLFSMGWVGDYPDAQNFLQLFHSSNVSPGPNHCGYRSAEFDREYDAAMAASDEETRNRHWRRCQEIVRTDAPWIFLHYNRNFSLLGPRLGNYVPSAFPYGNERHYRPLAPNSKSEY